jgi:hypothetical protein
MSYNHIGVDRRHKFVRRYVVSDARVHDSQEFEDVLDTSNTASDVWADSAYCSQEIEEKLGRRGLRSRIHRKAYRNRKLSEAQKAANATRSKVRARIEHVPLARAAASTSLDERPAPIKPTPRDLNRRSSRIESTVGNFGIWVQITLHPDLPNYHWYRAHSDPSNEEALTNPARAARST